MQGGLSRCWAWSRLAEGFIHGSPLTAWYTSKTNFALLQYGSTPLIDASRRGRTDVVNVLAWPLTLHRRWVVVVLGTVSSCGLLHSWPAVDTVAHD